MKQLYIITGYSGAGKSTVLEACEDYGFFCVDNLPAELLSKFFDTIGSPRFQDQSIALGLDIRSGMHQAEYLETILSVKKLLGRLVKIIFLQAKPEVLIQRFRETRRNHPLHAQGPLEQVIDHEKNLLAVLKEHADFIIDTDYITIAQLRLWVRHISCPDEKQPVLAVTLTSFGFKWGDAPPCDSLFDLRFLSNPHHVSELRMLQGDDVRVQEWLFKQADVREYWDHFHDFFLYILERYRAEGRFFVTIGFGCTGGQHRSVALVERCARLSLPNVHFFVHHKDKARSASIVSGDYHEKNTTF